MYIIAVIYVSYFLDFLLSATYKRTYIHKNLNICLEHKHFIQHHRFYFSNLILIVYINLTFFALRHLPTHRHPHAHFTQRAQFVNQNIASN